MISSDVRYSIPRCHITRCDDRDEEMCERITDMSYALRVWCIVYTLYVYPYGPTIRVHTIILMMVESVQRTEDTPYHSMV